MSCMEVEHRQSTLSTAILCVRRLRHEQRVVFNYPLQVIAKSPLHALMQIGGSVATDTNIAGNSYLSLQVDNTIQLK